MYLKLKNWKLGTGKDRYIAASVPGDITRDLYEAGEIADPYFGLNHLSLGETLDRDYDYVTTFSLGNGDVKRGERAFLRFKGVDLTSDIFLNGIKIGSTGNMFLEYVFDVTDELRKGENKLVVKMRSTTAYMKTLDCKNYFAVFNVPRILLRKEQCCFGWDWAPDIPGYGIWQDVELYTENENRITDVRVTANADGEAVFHIEINYSVRPYYDNDGNLVTPPKDHDDKLRVSLARRPVHYNEGEKETAFGFESKEIDVSGYKSFVCFTRDDAELWYPIGYGRQPLYSYRVELVRDGKVISVKTGRTGFRSVSLVEPALGDTRLGYNLIINGTRVYPKGANWVPIDCFTGAIEDAKYEKLISYAADGNFNILRVWGGGIYEKDIFYDLCDEKGVMVWQDFMFACADIPESEPEWLKNAEEECAFQVVRLRNHPSLVYWCGGNEKTGSFGAKISLGDRFTNVILRGIVDHYDGTRPFARQSPCSHTDAGNDFMSGESHFSCFETCMREGYDRYREAVARQIVTFSSECATMGPHSVETYRKIFPEDKLFPINEYWHDRLMENPYAAVRMPFAEAQNKMASDLYGAPVDIESFVEKASLAHAETLRCQIEYQRAHKGMTGGFLMWMYSEPWPSGTWSVIDYYTEPKQAYYASARAFAPLYFGFYLGADGKTYLFGVRDRTGRARVVYEWGAKTLDGRTVFVRYGSAELDDSTVIREPVEEKIDYENEYLYVRFREDDEQKTTVYSPDMWKSAYKNLKSDVTAKTRADGNRLVVTVSARAFAKSVFLHFTENCGYAFSDNFFDVGAGEEYEVSVTRDDGTLPDARGFKVSVSGKDADL